MKNRGKKNSRVVSDSGSGSTLLELADRFYISRFSGEYVVFKERPTTTERLVEIALDRSELPKEADV